MAAAAIITPMLIRPPTAADVEAMARIEVEARVAAEQSWSPRPRGLRARSVDDAAAGWRQRLDGSARVAVSDLRVVGCAAWRVVHGVPELTGPFVDPLHWRTGVGRALAAVAMRRARLQGHERMQMWIPAADPRARAFARAMGFVLHGASPVASGARDRVLRVAVLPASLALGRPED